VFFERILLVHLIPLLYLLGTNYLYALLHPYRVNASTESL
jgi:hypothetical protein